ncbi:MAG: tetratricopeptide repeat protein [Gemmatimonadota bacterium]
MAAPVLSERDLAALRSFARRIDPADAGAHNNLGVLYYQKGLVSEAVAAFARALELDPRMQVAQTNLEIAYRDSGHYDRRVAELQERLRRTPDDREARWELGRTYAYLKQHAEAVAEFEALLARNPGDVAGMIQLGLARRAQGRVEEASEWFARACTADPESAVALFYHGETLYNRGLNEPALAALLAATARNPEYADAHYLLAFVYGDMGRHDDARAAAKRAIALNPAFSRAQANLTLVRPANDTALPEPPRPEPVGDSALAHFNLGLAFRQKGYLVEALREYRLALDAGEDRRLVLQAMAEIELLRRELASALDLYEGLVAEFPDSPKLWNERGVCLHQSGNRAAAEESYGRAVDLDPAYVLAWNNLGVLRAHDPLSPGALDAFRRAARGSNAPATVRLNLALLHVQRHELQPALEGYRSVLAADPANAVAWNGVGLVLMELRRHAEARTAFQRAIEADDALASAHYNLSFTLSQLGDFDGALRETKRALELEPFYVPQKYALALDLQYEDPTIAIAPPITTEVGGEALAGEFAFDTGVLDQLFSELAPARPVALPEPAPVEDQLALARDYVAKGLLEHATAELGRARARGADPAGLAVLAGDLFARRGLHGEALERYREARALRPELPEALLGEVRALIALGRAEESLPLADELSRQRPGDADILIARAKARLEAGDSATALAAVREALAVAPARPDLYQLQALVAGRLGDMNAALEACQLALRIDAGLVQVWHELGRLEEQRENWTGARAAYERALDLLPTFREASLALADLVRRTDSPTAAVGVLVGMLSADPYDFEALTLLGRCLLESGRTADALQALDRVLRFHADDVDALFHRGTALARERHFHHAVACWDRVVQLQPASPLAVQARSRARSARDLAHILVGSER